MESRPVEIPVDKLTYLRSNVDAFMRENGLYAQLRQAIGTDASSTKLLAKDKALQEVIRAMESGSDLPALSGIEAAESAPTGKGAAEDVFEERLDSVDLDERVLRLEILGGRAFLDFDEDVGPGRATAGRFFVLYGSFGSQRFRTEPVPACSDPELSDTIDLRLPAIVQEATGAFRSMPTLPELLRLKVPIRLALALVTVSGPRESTSAESKAAASGAGAAGGFDALPFESDVASAAVRTEVLAEATVEWRRVLQQGTADIAVPLPALGPAGAGGVSIGVLALRLRLLPGPSKSALRPREEVGALLREEEIGQEVAARRLFEGARRWWREFLAIGGPSGGYRRRTVRAFARECRGGSRCVCGFVQPLMAPRLIETPRQAARFVGLLPLRAAGEEGGALGGGVGGPGVGSTSSATGSAVGPDGAGEAAWQHLHTTLAARGGCIEDLANLLCSLLLGFGLDAWVCLGTSIGRDGMEDSHAWVITLSTAESDTSGVASPAMDVVVWEPLTGERTPLPAILESQLAMLSAGGAREEPQPQPQPAFRYGRVGCLYNDRRLLANKYASDGVDTCNFNVDDVSHWHELEPALIEAACPPPAAPPALCRPTVDANALADALQEALRGRILRARRSASHAEGSLGDVRFDAKLEHVLSPALAAYESERAAGIATGSNDFQAAVRRSVPAGYVFRACPVQFSHASPDGVMEGLLATDAGRGVVLARGGDIQMAVAVKVVAFPEDVVAVWVMVAARFRDALDAGRRLELSEQARSGVPMHAASAGETVGERGPGVYFLK